MRSVRLLWETFVLRRLYRSVLPWSSTIMMMYSPFLRFLDCRKKDALMNKSCWCALTPRVSCCLSRPNLLLPSTWSRHATNLLWLERWAKRSSCPISTRNMRRMYGSEKVMENWLVAWFGGFLWHWDHGYGSASEDYCQVGTQSSSTRVVSLRRFQARGWPRSGHQDSSSAYDSFFPFPSF